MQRQLLKDTLIRYTPIVMTFGELHWMRMGIKIL